ncbi:MAG TPA: methyltransferase [Candidatus Limnocylindria bacterium]|nr:methyltransferase [Candidatus Limnocylindria bacterium]
MGGCCRPGDIDDVFDEKNARKQARSYARTGLGGTSRQIVALIRERLAPGYTILEAGGGIGAIPVELLTAGGATSATNVELSTTYEAVASELLRERGLEGRVSRRIGDFVSEAASMPPADVVVLDRVVCCYPDADRLVAAAAAHARRLLVLAFPVDRWWIRLGLGLANLLLRVRRSAFRGFAHPTVRVIAAAEREGLRLAAHRRGLIWQIVAFERAG